MWTMGAKTAAKVDALVDLVGCMFEIRESGEPQDFLSIHICWDCSAGTIIVEQEDKAGALAAEVGVQNIYGADVARDVWGVEGIK
jgi:hypothetical protein